MQNNTSKQTANPQGSKTYLYWSREWRSGGKPIAIFDSEAQAKAHAEKLVDEMPHLARWLYSRAMYVNTMFVFAHGN